MPIPDERNHIGASPGTTLGEEVFRRLYGAILDGTLIGGERVRDADIAAWLGVSRTPVRDAFASLERLGLIEVVASRYTVVTEVTEDLIAATLEYTGYSAGIGMHMAVTRMTEAEARTAVHILRRMLSASDADDRLTLYDEARALYGHIAVFARNDVYRRVLSEAGLAMERNLRERRPLIGGVESRGHEYRELIAAIERRDAAAAERSVRHQHEIRD
ncbi:GntR family transcriptional regulator [Glaciibacter flavus]|uniref:GntR family transcriptional regulator n=1 Tax=Orlajensenia flava TaxID=2565934 RepID=UPI0022A6658B|nr:GntR family transcriptional regulator [Glaciibacter flavus]